MVKREQVHSRRESEPARKDEADLSGPELGMRVAREVMAWRLDQDEFAESWIDSEGRLTGYYYGRPFSPYRDRNALREVLDRIEKLGLRDRYLEELRRLLALDAGASENVTAWALLTCPPEIACRAALLAVRAKPAS